MNEGVAIVITCMRRAFSLRSMVVSLWICIISLRMAASSKPGCGLRGDPAASSEGGRSRMLLLSSLLSSSSRWCCSSVSHHASAASSSLLVLEEMVSSDESLSVAKWFGADAIEGTREAQPRSRPAWMLYFSNLPPNQCLLPYSSDFPSSNSSKSLLQLQAFGFARISAKCRIRESRHGSGRKRNR